MYADLFVRRLPRVSWRVFRLLISEQHERVRLCARARDTDAGQEHAEGAAMEKVQREFSRQFCHVTIY